MCQCETLRVLKLLSNKIYNTSLSETKLIDSLISLHSTGLIFIFQETNDLLPQVHLLREDDINDGKLQLDYKHCNKMF